MPLLLLQSGIRRGTYPFAHAYGARCMADLTVYEKHTCTTCRNLAELLREHGIDYDAVDFHVYPLTEPELRALVGKTGEPARDLFRTREPIYAELGLADR